MRNYGVYNDDMHGTRKELTHKDPNHIGDLSTLGI